MNEPEIQAVLDVARLDEDGKKCWCLHQTLFRLHDPACLLLKKTFGELAPPPQPRPSEEAPAA